MRKTTLVLGILYLVWSIWQFFTVARLLSLYQEFNANIPQYPYLIPTLIFLFALMLIGAYFANLKKQASYKILVTVGILGIIVYFLYIFIAGSIANKQIYQGLNKEGLIK
jgi:DMSO reductase anchor subunit